MTIDVHTHYVPPALAERLRTRTEPPWIETRTDGTERMHMPAGFLDLTSNYFDLDERRDFMREVGVAHQVLSFPGLFGLDSLPAGESGPLLDIFNKEVAAAVKAHPDAFTGLAALPFADIGRAVATYRHGRQELGLGGAILPNNAFVSRAEAERLRPIFDAAEEMGGHLFVHPGRRPDEVLPPGAPAAPPFGDNAMARQALAVQHQVAACMTTLLFTDFLDPYEKLTIHVANLGGTLPMVIERMDHMVLTRTPGEPLPSSRARRLHVDCSSLGPNAIEIGAKVFGADRILFGTDCPIFSTAWSLEAVAKADIGAKARENILYRNAERLLADIR